MHITSRTHYMQENYVVTPLHCNRALRNLTHNNFIICIKEITKLFWINIRGLTYIKFFTNLEIKRIANLFISN